MNTKIKRKSGSFLKLEAKQLSAACHLGNFALLVRSAGRIGTDW